MVKPNNGTSTNKAVDDGKEPYSVARLLKFIKGMKVELVFGFYAVPGYLCIIALLLLPIEKVRARKKKFPIRILQS